MTSLNEQIQAMVKADPWKQEARFSVFVQPDKDFYFGHEHQFIHKYRVLRALVKHFKPASIIELGVLGGAGAQAMLSGVDFKATYHGFDLWGPTSPYFEAGEWKEWDRYQLCVDMFKAHDFKDYRLTKTDLRDIDEIPQAEFVVVDAAHDYRNCYWDLNLALTANPKRIYVDDMVNPELQLAVRDFAKYYKGRVSKMEKVEQISGGCLITLNEQVHL